MTQIPTPLWNVRDELFSKARVHLYCVLARPLTFGERPRSTITINVLPAFHDPTTPGVYLSRKNLLEGNNRKFNLERLMAFGTAATCFIPVEMRHGGKHPGQRRFFRGVILGYEDHMRCVWDIQDRVIRILLSLMKAGIPSRTKTKWFGLRLLLSQNFSIQPSKLLMILCNGVLLSSMTTTLPRLSYDSNALLLCFLMLLQFLLKFLFLFLLIC